MLVSSALPTRAGRILIACPAEEEHTYAPLALSLLLRRRGWDTVYLGANVPLVDFEATVATTRPSLVVMTAQQLYTAANLAEAADLLFEKGIPLAFGGLIFSRIPKLAESIAGHYLGDSLDGAVEVVEVLMRGLTLKPAHRVPSAAFEAALAHYRERLPLVEAEVWRRLENSVIPQRMLAQANLHFGRNLAAALALGDVDHLSVDVEWVEGMLVHHAGMPVDYVDGYLETYVEAMRMTMDERGRPAIDGLVKLLGIEPSPNASQSSQTTHIAS
jgi:methylmalonyl-CoA mutase cobalamin-binding subunit